VLTWKKVLIVIALLVALSASGYWGVTGINPGKKLVDLGVLLTSAEQTRIGKLEASTAAALTSLISDLEAAGLSVYVGQTLRTKAEEQAAIDSGHSAVTTHSWHEIGRAVDLYPINPDTGKADLPGARVDLFKQMADAAAGYGFTSLAFNADGSKRILHTSTGKALWDGGHLEFHGDYSSIADAVAAEGANFGIA
jgi:hypothetical protein